MKIGPQDPSAFADAAGTGKPRAAQTSAADTRAALIRAGGVASSLGAATPVDTVSISQLASGAMAEVGSADVDMDKVRRLQLALEQGTYKANPEAIADELIAHAQALLKPGL